MAQLTREAGTVVSAVMLGCIAASGVLPFGRDVFEGVVRGESGLSRARRPRPACAALRLASRPFCASVSRPAGSKSCYQPMSKL
jgi:indolepyruvate ferredoxin oxidoreductase beta subunit